MKNKGFGKYLRECREPIMSLQDLADILDCSKPYLWDIEKGNTKVQEAQRVPYKINPSRNTLRYIVIKGAKIKDKEKIFKKQ